MIFPEELWCIASVDISECDCVLFRNKVHLQIILFGREHCRARGHDMKTCPICSWAATKMKEEIKSEPLVTAIDRATKIKDEPKSEPLATAIDREDDE